MAPPRSPEARGAAASGVRHASTTAQVHLGDCLAVLGRLPARSCRLVYLDPPFFTQRRHSLATRARDKTFAFDDMWPSAAAYAGFLHTRLRAIADVLADRGSVFFHCDRAGVHIARATLDAVFGARACRAEIVWSYRRWSNARRGLLARHQTILWYAPADDYVFNPMFEPYAPSTNVDQLLQQRGRDRYGKAVYARDASGCVVPSAPKRGVPLGDVWDIPFLNPKARERVGYPTQKPVALLERIVALATLPGDLVLDPFCGSGTTLVAAVLLGRGAVGIDASEDAVALARSRIDAPVRTASRLREGQASADTNAGAESLAALRGIPHVPVRRNRGVDALVPCGKGNAMIRVQREGEALDEAADALVRASMGKGAPLLVVLASSPVPRGYRSSGGVVVVPTTAALLETLLRRHT